MNETIKEILKQLQEASTDSRCIDIDKAISYYNAICIIREDRKHDIFFDKKTRKLLFVNYGYDVLYDLIKDGLVEKVEDSK